ncbi:MAG TPA: hypothetical protein DCQ26_18100 [Marinilabiliales bacterium]|jgi:hypothetical protein|nr:MAG: hypothetical protein A2W95_16580 [Bacteroidetes bacterium GWA2_40_14]OFX59355.1 MAG: hypothetical protein A2W84_03865 [Bacteroidetes bacterium GWC2_40_13]OFX73552.1 MAG: hypothetical protein A2W96_02690 [Bacteroidetes bacterium GWD2_40_43]OFX90772.1 MAG: hypothetical protein A2W97_03350 [Bacteroidetes bacterium GWE2_40_63]OFY20596.1 MAG: hypothetical protein A2W88_13485 [Bacteroidetes bacterium GWF2_40_13]OFZ24688.1 MAG: hypothetical protein A2437_03815 [Bacteroidetes bacterium RIFOXYC
MKAIKSVLIYSFILGLLIIGCSPEKKGNYLSKLEVEIPDVLKGNANIVAFINENAEVLNQWSVTLEDLVVDCSPYLGKEEEELTDADRAKLGKNMMEFVANLGQFAVYSAELQQMMTTVEAELPDDQLAAFATIKNQLETRMQEIQNKYIDFGKEQDEE